MSIDAETNDLTCRLRQLEANPRRYKKSIHCGPPLSEADLSAFERDFGITLPLSYRRFLSVCGNGSIGPGLGVLPLHRWLLVLETAPALPEILSANCLLTPDLGAQGPEWLQLVGPADFERQLTNSTWSPYQGCITISDLGCCMYAVMPVNGPHVGTIWQVDHDYHPPILYPFRTFTEWLFAWCKVELATQFS